MTIDLTIERIELIPIHNTITYRAYTDKGICDIQQVVDADSLYDGMFYDTTWGGEDLNFKKVVQNAIAWELDMNEYFKREQEKEQDMQADGLYDPFDLQF